jgi:hypothetical protein
VYLDAGFGHRLITANHLKSFPRRVMYLDTESRIISRLNDELHVFRLAVTSRVDYRADGRAGPADEKLWRSARELCAYLALQAKPKSPLTVYGHALYFDLQVAEVFVHFEAWGWKPEFIYDNGLTFILTVSHEGGRIRFVSTTNYFDCSLAELAHSCGMKQVTVDFKTFTEGELEARCAQDVAILKAAMEGYFAFNRLHNTGRFAYSRSGQCLAVYRHRFMGSPIHVHSSEEVIALERSAYFGGRCEAYQLGRIAGGPFRFYDVNSMYPSVMRSKQYPCKLLRYYPSAELGELLPFRGLAAIVAEVELETTEPLYAKRIGAHMMFPVGRFTTSVCTEGFWRAVDAGALRGIRRAAVYQWDSIFRAYVDYWWPLKRHYQHHADTLYAGICKSFLNSLYGKFGQRATRLDPVERPLREGPYRVENYNLQTGERWIEYRLLGQSLEAREVGNARYSFVAVAAHVAEYARFALWDLCCRIGRPRILYVDTDSVVVRSVDGPPIDRELCGPGLGALGLDRHCAELVLHGAKDYSADGIEVIKGVPKAAVETTSGSYEYTQFATLKMSLASGIAAGVVAKTVTKRLTRRYDKGRVDKDGRVHPWVLDEL